MFVMKTKLYTIKRLLLSLRWNDQCVRDRHNLRESWALHSPWILNCGTNRGRRTGHVQRHVHRSDYSRVDVRQVFTLDYIPPPPSPSENQSQWKLLQKVRYIFFHLIIIFLVRLAKSVEKHSRKTGLSKIYFRFFFYNSLHVASVKRIVFSELYNSWDNLVDSFFYFYIGRSTYLWILQTLRILVLRPLRVR